MMDDTRKSDGPIVPAKPSNKAEPSAAEGVEGRGPAEGNMGEQNAPRTQRRIEGAPSALDRVRQRARQDRRQGSRRSFTTSPSSGFGTRTSSFRRGPHPESKA